MARRDSGCVRVGLVPAIPALPLVLCLLVFHLAGCDSGTQTEVNTATSPGASSRSASSSTVPAWSTSGPSDARTTDTTLGPLSRATHWGQSQEIASLLATVEAPLEEVGSQREGRKTVLVEVTLLNQSAEDSDYDNRQFTAYDEAGRKYVSTGTTSPQPLTAGSLAPLESVHGFLAYDLPSDATVARVAWHKDVFEWVNEWVWQ